jgi:hypothetical protein
MAMPLVIGSLVAAIALSSCGHPANAANPSKPTSVPSTTQQAQPTHSNSVNGTDQQIQSILHQLDGAQNDVKNSDSAANQDGGN